VRVLVANTYVPFVDGGGRIIASDLASALRERGHEVEKLDIPFSSVWHEMLEQMLAIRMIDVQEQADVLITIRTPSHLLRHPNKRTWFIHHHRGAYDLWGTPYQDIPSTPRGIAVRDAIRAADNVYLPESQRIFTNSRIVGERLREYNDIDSTVLYPPLGAPARFVTRESSNYVFYPSRMLGHKRQLLAVEAAAHLTTDARIVLAGVPDDPGYLEQLRAVIAEHRLEDRVELMPTWIDEQAKADLIASSMGVLYLPFLEDSYGYVTLEAFHAAKPVITCQDSGGTLEIVEDSANGLVVAPDPGSLARAIDRLRESAEQARAMGAAGQRSLAEHEISWDNVVSSLLG
jgi:glycosyltransferase involved in cell wall biosynthesis